MYSGMEIEEVAEMDILLQDCLCTYNIYCLAEPVNVVVGSKFAYSVLPSSSSVATIVVEQQRLMGVLYHDRVDRIWCHRNFGSHRMMSLVGLVVPRKIRELDLG